MAPHKTLVLLCVSVNIALSTAYAACGINFKQKPGYIAVDFDFRDTTFKDFKFLPPDKENHLPRILVAGSAERVKLPNSDHPLDSNHADFLLASFRFNISSSDYQLLPDHSFGEEGIVRLNFAGRKDSANAIEIIQHPDGTRRIFAGGCGENAARPEGSEDDNLFDFVLSCYTEDGKLCQDFGKGGTVTHNFITNTGHGDMIYALASMKHRDGKPRIIVGGRGYKASWVHNPISTHSHTTVTGHKKHMGYDAVLASYTLDGTLDHTFGDHGFVVFEGRELDSIQSLNTLILPDKKEGILAGGYWGPTLVDQSLLLTQLDQQGAPSKHFGKDGFASLDTGCSIMIKDTLILDVPEPFKRILVAGSPAYRNGCKHPLVASYTTSGKLDHNFGQNGITEVIQEGEVTIAAQALLTQPDGSKRILVAGHTPTKEITGVKPASDDFFIASLFTNGLPDPSFGQNGYVTLDLNQQDDRIHSLSVIPWQDGSTRIVAVGDSYNAVNPCSRNDGVIVILKADGSLDPLFGATE